MGARAPFQEPEGALGRLGTGMVEAAARSSQLGPRQGSASRRASRGDLIQGRLALSCILTMLAPRPAAPGGGPGAGPARGTGRRRLRARVQRRNAPAGPKHGAGGASESNVAGFKLPPATPDSEQGQLPRRQWTPGRRSSGRRRPLARRRTPNGRGHHATSDGIV